MWWNFVGRTHEEIVKFRAQWQAEIGAEPGDATVKRFGEFPDGEPAAAACPGVAHRQAAAPRLSATQAHGKDNECPWRQSLNGCGAR